MGQVNSSQGQQERRVSQPESSFEFETNANIVHNGVHSVIKPQSKVDVRG